MPRGRKPLSKPEAIDPKIDHEKLSQDLAVISQDAKRLSQIDELYGDGKIYSRRRIVVESRGLIHTAGEALLELGKRLLLIKEHEPHGEFLDALNEIGIEATFAQRAMKAAVKFCGPNAAAPQHLGGSKTAAPQLFAGLGQTKLIELLVLDDEEIADLGEGGTVAGLTLDEIDRMSTRELRLELRKNRQKYTDQQETHERLLADKNKKIDELDARIHHRERLAGDELNEAQFHDLERAATSVTASTVQFRKVMEEIYARDEIPDHLKQHVRNMLSYMVQTLLRIRDDYALEVNIEEEIYPSWLDAESLERMGKRREAVAAN